MLLLSPQWDFTLLNGVLFVFVFVLMAYGIILLFVRSYVSGSSPANFGELLNVWTRCLLASVGVFKVPGTELG